MILALVITNWLQVQLDRWNKAEVRPEKVHYVQAIVAQIERNKSRYVTVASKTGVPWQVIGAIHSLEASLSFKGNLANGDSLNARTRHVPIGRPPTGNPPFSWEDAANDSLNFDNMGAKDWGDIAHRCNNTEGYNGFGHQRFHKDVPTPYLWAFSTVEKRGKYIEDGQWSSTAQSQQAGAATIWKVLK